MAHPVILVNSSTGSDTAASGAGPSTAISGSTGRTRSAAGELRFGMFGATDDFSGVATDGSAVLFASISTGGIRNFSSIAATKNTRHTTTGNITSGAAVLSALGSTTGWAVGDVIKVTGAAAAAADLYSTILTVDSSTQVTLNNNAGTSVTGNAVENPKQFTLTTGEGMNTGTTNTAWAVGGKRLTLSSSTSRRLAENTGVGDAMPGWIVRCESGFTDTFASALTFRRNGDLSSGPVTFEGDPSSLSVLTFSNNSNSFVLVADLVVIQHFDFRNTNGTKTASIAIVGSGGSNCMIRNIVVTHVTNNYWKALTTGLASGWTIQDCEFAETANCGMEFASAASDVINCWVHNTKAVAGIVMSGNAATQPLFVDTIVNNCTGDGIRSTRATTTPGMGGFTLINCTIHGNSDDGIEATATSTALGGLRMTLINCNITSNTGIGLNLSGAGLGTIDKCVIMLRGNNFHGNGSVCNVAGLVREEEQTLDPQYVNAASGDFSIGTNLRAKGYPVGGTTPIGRSLTYSYKDIGVAQRKEYASNPSINSGF